MLSLIIVFRKWLIINMLVQNISMRRNTSPFLRWRILLWGFLQRLHVVSRMDINCILKHWKNDGFKRSNKKHEVSTMKVGRADLGYAYASHCTEIKMAYHKTYELPSGKHHVPSLVKHDG